MTGLGYSKACIRSALSLEEMFPPEERGAAVGIWTLVVLIVGYRLYSDLDPVQLHQVDLSVTRNTSEGDHPFFETHAGKFSPKSSLVETSTQP